MSCLSLRSLGLSSDSAALDRMTLKSHFPRVSGEAEARPAGQ